MVEAHVINIFDAVVVGIMLLSCIFAFYRGFVREVLSLSAWVGAAIVTLYYFPVVAEKLQPHFKKPDAAAAIATLLVYIGALLGFSLINTLILKFIKKGTEVGMLDNLFGLAFGALRGAFIISLGFFLITIAMKEEQYPKWLKQSMTRPYIEKGAVALARIAPDYLREISTLQKKAMAKMNADEDAPADDVSSDSASSEKQENTGYRKNTAHQLDRLIESTDHNQ